MLITLVDARTIRLSFPYYAPMVDAIKTMAGHQWHKDSETWTVPLYHLRRVLEHWPGARIEDGVEDARLELWHRWIRQYNALGVWFELAEDGQTVVAQGEGVSPALQEWVWKHNGEIRPVLVDQLPLKTHQNTPKHTISVDPSAADTLIWQGIQNAHAAERRAVYQKPRKRKVKLSEQMELYR